MRQLKNTIQSSSPSLENDDSQVKNTQQEQVANFSFPEKWQRAFAMGQNVRFTRTPEVELLRRRIENDPEFAEKWKTLDAAKKASPNSEALHQESDEIAINNTQQEIVEESIKQGSSIEHALYLSDSAFFEFDGFSIADVNAIINKPSLDKIDMVALENNEEITKNAHDITPNPVLENHHEIEPSVSVNNAPLAINVLDFYRKIDGRQISYAALLVEDVQAKYQDKTEEPTINLDEMPANEVLMPTPLKAFEPVIPQPVDLEPVALEAVTVEPVAILPENNENLGTGLSIYDRVQAIIDANAAKDNIAKENAAKENTVKDEEKNNLPTQHNDDETRIKDSVGISKQSNLIENSVKDENIDTIKNGENNLADTLPIVENSLIENSVLEETPSDKAIMIAKAPSKLEVTPEIEPEIEREKPKLKKTSQAYKKNLSIMSNPVSLGHENYCFPDVDYLQEPIYQDGAIIPQDTLERSAGLLESVLEDFGIKGEIIHVRPGPVVTLYEFEPAAGVKSSRVIGLSDDIARSMAAISARVAVIPGRNVIGIELPNSVRETVYLRELIAAKAFQQSTFKLPLALGKSIGGEPVIAELAKMPHLLVAGTTGSGKSVAINTMILSLLYRLSPEECRLIMVDPKMLELSIYDGIPHLLTPVVTDSKKAVTALKWAVREMEERYRKMAKLGVRNIDGFNARVAQAVERGETIMCTVQSGFDKETGEMLYHEEAMDLTKLPFIVVIVDEMADLMMVAGKEIEGAIQRLAQMARAAGIHLIMATQRPSVDVITGTIKANFPTRISFQVTSKIDSRTILGEQGAETLLGQGDMLHMVGGGRIVRVHGPFVSDEEVEQVVAHLKTQGTPDYLATVTDEEEEDTLDDAGSVADIVAASSTSDDSEELYLQALKVVMRDKKCSTSYIQRRLSIGYNKAASLVERMEKEGIVGTANHVGKREILVNNHVHNRNG